MTQPSIVRAATPAELARVNLVHVSDLDSAPDGLIDDTPVRDSKIKAGFAADAVVTYADDAGLLRDPMHDALTELVRDLRHLCAALDQNWHTIAEAGTARYRSDLGSRS